MPTSTHKGQHNTRDSNPPHYPSLSAAFPTPDMSKGGVQRSAAKVLNVEVKSWHGDGGKCRASVAMDPRRRGGVLRSPKDGFDNCDLGNQLDK